MNVKKAERTPEPGYPSRRQFAESARVLGMAAAIGLGTMGAACAADNQPPRPAGIPLPPSMQKEAPAKPAEVAKPAQTAKPAEAAKPAPATPQAEAVPRTAGKIRAEPSEVKPVPPAQAEPPPRIAGGIPIAPPPAPAPAVTDKKVVPPRHLGGVPPRPKPPVEKKDAAK